MAKSSTTKKTNRKTKKTKKKTKKTKGSFTRTQQVACRKKWNASRQSRSGKNYAESTLLVHCNGKRLDAAPPKAKGKHASKKASKKTTKKSSKKTKAKKTKAKKTKAKKTKAKKTKAKKTKAKKTKAKKTKAKKAKGRVSFSKKDQVECRKKWNASRQKREGKNYAKSTLKAHCNSKRSDDPPESDENDEDDEEDDSEDQEDNEDNENKNSSDDNDDDDENDDEKDNDEKDEGKKAPPSLSDRKKEKEGKEQKSRTTINELRNRLKDGKKKNTAVDDGNDFKLEMPREAKVYGLFDLFTTADGKTAERLSEELNRKIRYAEVKVDEKNFKQLVNKVSDSLFDTKESSVNFDRWLRRLINDNSPSIIKFNEDVKRTMEDKENDLEDKLHIVTGISSSFINTVLAEVDGTSKNMFRNWYSLAMYNDRFIYGTLPVSLSTFPRQLFDRGIGVVNIEIVRKINELGFVVSRAHPGRISQIDPPDEKIDMMRGFVYGWFPVTTVAKDGKNPSEVLFKNLTENKKLNTYWNKIEGGESKTEVVHQNVYNDFGMEIPRNRFLQRVVKDLKKQEPLLILDNRNEFLTNKLKLNPFSPTRLPEFGEAFQKYSFFAIVSSEFGNAGVLYEVLKEVMKTLSEL